MSSGGSLKLKIKFPTFGQNQPEKGAAGSEGQHKKRKREPGAPGPSQPAASQPGKPAKTARSAQSGLPDPPRFQTNLQASPEPSPPQQRRDIYRSDRDKAAAAALKLRLGSNAAASTSQLSGTNVTANHAALQPARGSSAAQQGSTQQQRPTVSDGRPAGSAQPGKQHSMGGSQVQAAPSVTSLHSLQNGAPPQPSRSSSPVSHRSGPTSEPPPPAAVPDVPATKEALLKALQKVQRKDERDIFRHPVTEAQAPGYFSVVQKAMDFTTLADLVSSGTYSDWNAFLADLQLIFMNALKYNTPDTIYHKHAQRLLGVAQKIGSMARQGIQDMRGRRAGPKVAQPSPSPAPAADPGPAAPKSAQGSTRAAGMSVRPSPPPSAKALSAAATAKPTRAAPKGTYTPSSSKASMLPPPDENARASHQALWGAEQGLQDWKGLASACNAEGMQVACSRLDLRATWTGALAQQSYIASMARFAEGCAPHIRDLVMARAKRVPPAPVQPPTIHSLALHKPPAKTHIVAPRPLAMPGPSMGSSSIPPQRPAMAVVGGMFGGVPGALPPAPIPNVNRTFSPTLQQLPGSQQHAGMTLGGLGMPLVQGGSRPVSGLMDSHTASWLPGGSQQPAWPLPQQPHSYPTSSVLPGGSLPGLQQGSAQPGLGTLWRPSTQ